MMLGNAQQGGYTLAEMLAALLIVSLAMSGLVEASFLIGRLQSATAAHVARFDEQRSLQERFSSLVADRGPFRSDEARLQGDEGQFAFACGTASCGAAVMETGSEAALSLRTPTMQQITLGVRHAAHFLYVGSSTTGDVWPPQGVTRQRLQAILLLSQDGAGFSPIATARIWRQEDPACLFDAIVKDCRNHGS